MMPINIDHCISIFILLCLKLDAISVKRYRKPPTTVKYKENTQYSTVFRRNGTKPNSKKNYRFFYLSDQRKWMLLAICVNLSLSIVVWAFLIGLIAYLTTDDKKKLRRRKKTRWQTVEQNTLLVKVFCPEGMKKKKDRFR